MLVTFNNCRWLGYVHAPGTPICIQSSRIRAVTIQDRFDVVVQLDDSNLIVSCETREAALSEQARIAREANGTAEGQS